MFQKEKEKPPRKILKKQRYQERYIMERQPRKGLSQRMEGMKLRDGDESPQGASQGAASKDYEHVYRLSANNNERGASKCYRCKRPCEGDRYKTKDGERLEKIFCLRCVISIQNYDCERVRSSKKNEFTGTEVEQIRLAKKRFTEYLENKPPTVTTPLVGKIFKDILEQEIRENREVVKILEDMEQSLENEDGEK